MLRYSIGVVSCLCQSILQEVIIIYVVQYPQNEGGGIALVTHTNNICLIVNSYKWKVKYKINRPSDIRQISWGFIIYL